MIRIDLLRDARQHHKMRKIDVDPRRDKTEQPEPKKDAKCDCHVSPIPSKCARKILGEKLADQANALALGTVDIAVGADDEAVEIIDQLGITSLGSGGCKVGCSASVKLAEFPNLHPRQPAQTHPLLHRQKIFEPLPVVFFLFEKTIHSLVDFRFSIWEWQCKIQNSVQ